MGTNIKWDFDQSVTDIFDDMLQRSIPQYDIVRNTVTDLALHYYQDSTWLLDLGCSRGGAIAPIIERNSRVSAVGIEVSEPMYQAAKKRFKGEPYVDIKQRDLRHGIPLSNNVSVILSIFTLQFIPINYRQQILSEAYSCLNPGGALIITEKVLGKTNDLDRDMVTLYHRMKSNHGYTEEEITRKSLQLEGVLVPLTAEWNEAMLERAGFQVDSFWRWMNFMGWIAYKK